MATAAYTTVVDRAVGDPITEAIWDDQLRDNGNMLQGKASGNLLVNGGFEIWQRGTGSFTADQAYGADRWQQRNGSAASVTVTQETTTIATNSRYALKLVGTGNAAYSSAAYLEQKIDTALVYQLRGKALAVTVSAQQSVASKFSIAIEGALSTTGSSSTSATTGSYVTYTATATVNAAETALYIRIYFGGAATYYVDNAMLVIGPNACPYEPLHPQADLARCQRYYEFIGGVAVSIYFGGYQAAGNGVGFTLPYKVSKGGTPTVTKVGTWTVNNCSQPTVNNPSSESCNLQATVTATGGASFYTSNATDGITVEWNP